jgi:hypothetical protein
MGFYGLRRTEVVARRCREHEGDERSLRPALLEDLRAPITRRP